MNTVRNCIVWGNTSGAGAQNAADNLVDTSANVPLVVTYSAIQGGYPGAGNSSADPLFVHADPATPDAFDLHLTASSPCIDTAFDAADEPATDLDGNLRALRNGPDRGAYETNNVPHALVFQNSVSNDVLGWQLNGVTDSGSRTLIAQGLPSAWKVVAYADITSNESPALIWQNSVSGDVIFWQMQGFQPTGIKGYLSQGISPAWRIAAVADLNNDGKLDLLWQNNDNGDVVYWLMNGLTPGVKGYLAQGVPPTWRIVAAADLTGDGKPDLIWENSQSNDVVYWQMNGVTDSGVHGYLAQGVPLSWRIAAVVNVTGDAQPDLLWQNSGTGDTLYWAMNGTTVVSRGYLAQGVPAAWRVIGLN